jgi:hypothetical protein
MQFIRPRKAGGCTSLISGFILVVAGACVILFLGSDVTLTCKRSTDTCILEKTNVFGRKEVVASLPLSRVKSADVESHQAISKAQNRNPTYQIVLKTDDGNIPFSNAWTREIRAHRQNAAKINNYLSSSKESLVVVQIAKTVKLVGYLFMAVGCFALLRGFLGVLNIFRLFIPG